MLIEINDNIYIEQSPLLNVQRWNLNIRNGQIFKYSKIQSTNSNCSMIIVNCNLYDDSSHLSDTHISLRTNI